MTSLDVRTTPIQDLKPHPQNPRNGDIDAIKESLLANGQFKPIVAAADGTIIAGNHTYAAAMALGWDSLSVVHMPIPWDSPRAKHIMLADNRTSDLGLYDDSLLLSLLRDIDEEDSLLGTGYTIDDLDDLTAKIDEAAPLRFSPEQVADMPSMQEKLAKYQSMGRRMIVLDYDQHTYATITARLEHLRKRMDVQTNAEAIQALLAESFPDVVSPQEVPTP